MESVSLSVSDVEKERRHKNIRLLMEKRDIKCLVVAGASKNCNEKGSALRYIANYSPYYGEAFGIFPLDPDIEPELFLWSPTQAYWAGRISWFSAKYSGGYPYFPEIVSTINRLGFEKSKIGLVREDCFPGPVYKGLLEGLPRVKFESFTDDITRLEIIKSEEELKIQEKAAHLADLAYEAMIETARPGVREYEVWAAIEYAMCKNGAEAPNFNIICSGPSPVFPTFPASHRILEKGDTILTELSPCYAGYWVQFCRPVVLGQPSKELEALYKVCIEAYNIGVSMLNPGVRPEDINNKIAQFIQSKGFITLAHANVSEKGLHMTHASAEAQASLLEGLVIEPGMTFVNHPNVCNQEKTRGIIIGDMFVVTKDGPKNWNTSPLQLTIIDV